METRRTITDDRAAHFLSRIETARNLPSLPQVLLKLIEACRNEEMTIRDIAQIVSELGAEVTAFGEVSHFRSPGRAASPVAGVNALPSEQSRSVSFSGLPLASRYAILIDKTLGDNATLNWDALEDIVISVEYGYQDLFPANVCQ